MFLQGRLLELECLLGLGKLDELLSLVDDIVTQARTSGGKPDVEWGALGKKGEALQLRGDLVGAEAACREAMAAVRPTSIADASRGASLRLAIVLLAQQKFDEARSALATAEHACTNARPPCGADRRPEANLHAKLGELATRRSILVAMLDAARKAHDDRMTVWALRDLGQAEYEQLQSGDDCIAETREAIGIADAHPDLFVADQRADGYRGLGNMLGDRGRFDEAMAARQKALDILRAAGDDKRWQFSRNYPARILMMANRPVEAEQWARDALAGDSSRDDARATLVDALIAQGKVADAEKVVGELVGQSADALVARAWLALHRGKSATTERRSLETQLAELKKRGPPIDIARAELTLARLGVAAHDPGARKRLSGLAEDLRKQGLGGLAALADREAASN